MNRGQTWCDKKYKCPIALYSWKLFLGNNKLFSFPSVGEVGRSYRLVRRCWSSVLLNGAWVWLHCGVRQLQFDPRKHVKRHYCYCHSELEYFCFCLCCCFLNIRISVSFWRMQCYRFYYNPSIYILPIWWISLTGLCFRATLNMENCQKHHLVLNSTLTNSSKNPCVFKKFLEQVRTTFLFVFVVAYVPCRLYKTYSCRLGVLLRTPP